uniref:Intu_longin_1 domain-containing protein n=1 Tax=Rhabditophanes sp. KR3021 TaxID=114890 RepID=A0AC35U4K8_9BILA
MKGVLLVDNQDTVIFAAGDSDFANHINNFTLFNCHSGGDCTDTDTSSTSIQSSLNENYSFKVNASIDISYRQATDIFLPLILMYNMRKEQSNGLVHEIAGDRLKLHFKELQEEHFIIYVAETESCEDAKEIVRKINHAFKFYLGDFLTLLRSDLTSICHAKTLLYNRLLDIFSEKQPYHQLSLENDQSPKIGLEFCKNISENLRPRLVNNLVFLIKNLTIISSSGTNDSSNRTIFLNESMTKEDIQEIIQLSILRKNNEFSESFDSVWITLKRFKNRVAFVNVFCRKITSQYDVIIISPVESAWRFHEVYRLFDKFAELPKHPVNRSQISDITDTILKLFPTDNSELSGNSLTLHETYGRRIMNIWCKLITQLTANLSTDLYYNDRSPLAPDTPSLHEYCSSDSGVEVMSATNSFLTVFSKPRHFFSHIIDNRAVDFTIYHNAMITQIKRYFTMYLNDFLQLIKTDISTCQWKEIKKEILFCYAGHRSALARNLPNNVGISTSLDCMGYVFYCSDIPFSVNFSQWDESEMSSTKMQVEGRLKENLKRMVFPDMTNKEEMIEIEFNQIGTFYTVQYTAIGEILLTNKKSNSRWRQINPFSKKVRESSDLGVAKAFVVFNSLTNKELAIAQAKRIAEYYYNYTRQIAKCLYT